MSSSILYFPYIHLPNNQWLYRSLLYWDEIGTIIPVEYEIPSRSLLEELIQLKFARPIHPEDVIYRRRGFVKSFVEYVDDEDYPVKPGALSRGDKTMRIHMSKMIDVADELEMRGLARRDGTWWWAVERFTAGKFMAYLAGIAGGVTNMTPSTDRPEHLSVFLNLKSEEEAFRTKLDPDRTEVIDRILPVPTRKPDLKRLKKFKDQHRDELVNFREHLESFLVDLQDSSSQVVKEAKIERFRQQAEGEVQRLQELIKQSRLSSPRLGTMLSLSSASFGVVAASLATGPGALFGAIAAALGLVGGAYSTYSRIKESREQIRQSFGAYAMEYQKELGLQSL